MPAANTPVCHNWDKKECFACENGKCMILKEYIPDCPFYKPVQQYRRERLIYGGQKREE
jgi:hypothetical protein